VRAFGSVAEGVLLPGAQVRDEAAGAHVRGFFLTGHLARRTLTAGGPEKLSPSCQ
jgi:hypothetical protein